MKKMVKNFWEWSKLSTEEKNQQINSYWINNKVKDGLKGEIINELLSKLDKNKQWIKKIYFGWTGWYSPTIFIEIDKKTEIRLPRIFDIFEIKKVLKEKG